MVRSVFVFSDGWLQTGNYLHNPLQPLNSFGLKKSELKQGLHRNSTSWSVWRTERSIWNSAYRSQFRQKQKRSRSPAGPRRLGTATRMSASLSRRLSAFFESASGQGPKAAKFAALPPGHAGFPKRAERSEGSDTTPTSNTTCFAVCALVCDFSPKGECVHTFARESKRGPFVQEVEKRDERWSEIELLLIVGGHREPGNVCI